jgi:hypothetical protein
MGVSKAALRNLPIDKRMELMAAAEKPQVVHVVPASADIRRVLFHPRAGYFPADGGMDWPMDDFTFRRIQDGDVTVEKSGEQSPEGEPRHNEKRAGRGGASGGSG